MSPRIGGSSYWMESTQHDAFPALAEDASADVCIVGAGMTGILAAWELVEAGKSVIVLDAKRVASSVSGYTTSKLTSQHGLKYSHLEGELGAAAARSYGAANERALARIVEIATSLGIDAEIDRRAAYVYASHAASTRSLRDEAAAAARAGLPARFTDDVPLPFATHGAVVFEQQAQFHPRLLLLGIADALVARGCAIHEQTKVTELEPGEPCAAMTEGGATVRARHVVLATLTPSPVGSDLMPHLYCHQGYAIASPIDRDALAGGIYINADRPMRSLRTISHDGTLLLQVGGSAWVADPSSGATPWDDLDAWARDSFGTGEPTHRWTTQDYSSADGVPLIGSLDDDGQVYVATGFGGWGLTTAGVAAELIRDRIVGAPAEWHAIFDPRRELAIVDTATVSSHRQGLDMSVDDTIASLAPGSAIVLEDAGEEVAVHRDDDGVVHRVSAVCTHQCGIVLWDAADREWACPCHGSRFAPTGEVIKGPAKEPLPPR